MAFINSPNSPVTMPWLAGPTMFAPVITPVIVPDLCGQVWMTGGGRGVGGLGRFEQSQTCMPPLVFALPRWMWACVTLLCMSE
jgi:hypothetical protein